VRPSADTKVPAAGAEGDKAGESVVMIGSGGKGSSGSTREPPLQ
jgi:hypothetical protein